MRSIRITALVLMIQTIAWVILMAVSTRGIEPGWQALDYLAWASEGGISYLLNYLNVTLLTLLVIVLFSFLYQYLHNDRAGWATTGLVLVPCYGLLNVLVYSLQISIVPALAKEAVGNVEPGYWVAQMVQANPESLAGYANGLAYALLGITSVIYGILLAKALKPVSGYLLLSNGVSCLLGMAGYLTGNKALSFGMMLGGILFLLALGAMVWEFRPSREARS